MLREAELQRLQKCTDELETVVGQRNALSQQVASLQRHLEEVTHQSEESTTALRSATLEVDRLRNEELRLNRRLAALEDFRGDYPTAVAQRPTVTADSAALHDGDAVRQLMREEESERQELLLALFWEPMLIAFDAGLTWIADCEALRDEPHTAKSAASIPIPEEIWERKEVVPYQENRSYTNKGALTPPKDEDLLLLTNQQSEIVQLNSKVQLLQERLRICQLEKERFSFLYEGEQRRIEMLTQDHNEQLRRAYDELLRDREYIMRTLKDEIEDQVRNSFEDGCRYQRRQMRGKKSETEKQLVVTSKNKRH
ncbi:hypothetical protein AGDE_01016 [Angomonas deanei]|uniref:Uncharacterized protein n=1 Tax=Angomonas deanei TaxID=59799 RepID=A0A7G2CIS0_9TRYP|nr:hypothetical protein AGDE_01016 [Angomonas deanei]CAD2219748.1 hypothetical protein, conserved [Angomonas deanei]|eukprot:EPY42907.1 hypothetical protein AGDE_01016 [Angomonas deanei]